MGTGGRNGGVARARVIRVVVIRVVIRDVVIRGDCLCCGRACIIRGVGDYRHGAGCRTMAGTVEREYEFGDDAGEKAQVDGVHD